MSDAQWVASGNPQEMLNLAPSISPRKRALFACACWRRTRMVEQSEELRQMLQYAEQYADGEMTAAQWQYHVRTFLRPLPRRVTVPPAVETALSSMDWAALVRNSPGLSAQVVASERSTDTATLPQGLPRRLPDRLLSRPRPALEMQEVCALVQREQADLLRHLVGNPFRPFQLPGPVPSSIQQLAEAVYHGDDAAVGPLADACLDADWVEAAAHFHQASGPHPRGCWLIDRLTGRE